MSDVCHRELHYILEDLHSCLFCTHVKTCSYSLTAHTHSFFPLAKDSAVVMEQKRCY